MTNPIRLEDFHATQLTARPRAALPDLVNPAPASEEQTLAAYDKGYAAGWEDASQAAQQSDERLDKAMANNLEDLGFTYQEARAHVMRSLTPLLNGVLTTLLPRLIHETLGARIMEEVDKIAEERADTPIELMVPPTEVEQLRPVIERITALPLRLAADEAVPTGQIFLRIGNVEREIDLDGALASIKRALTALDELNMETARNG